MPNKANQLPKGGKLKTPPPKRNNLPLYVAGCALLVIAIGVALMMSPGRGSSGLANPPQVINQPKLAVDRLQIDFGKVPLDVPVKAAFKLTNVGDQPLQILNTPVVEARQGC